MAPGEKKPTLIYDSCNSTGDHMKTMNDERQTINDERVVIKPTATTTTTMPEVRTYKLNEKSRYDLWYDYLRSELRARALFHVLEDGSETTTRMYSEKERER